MFETAWNSNTLSMVGEIKTWQELETCLTLFDIIWTALIHKAKPLTNNCLHRQQAPDRPPNAYSGGLSRSELGPNAQKVQVDHQVKSQSQEQCWTDRLQIPTPFSARNHVCSTPLHVEISLHQCSHNNQRRSLQHSADEVLVASLFRTACHFWMVFKATGAPLNERHLFFWKDASAVTKLQRGNQKTWL